MSVPFAAMQKVLAYVSANLDGDVSLRALGKRANLSRFHLQRIFSNAIGETPRQFTFRLRLGRAAVLLLATRHSILDVALSCGFQNHETFCRAFQRRFGMTPRAYRRRGFAHHVAAAQVNDHIQFVNRVAPCLGLYHMTRETASEENEMTYTVSRKELAPQPVLVVRRRIRRSEIPATIGDALPHVFAYAQQHGIALTGLPFTRYLEVSHGLMTIEPGMRIAAPTPSAAPPQPPGETAVAQDTLPGGPVASTVHTGSYDSLSDAYAAIQQWIETQGYAPAGAPWESYLTDPADYPDPKDWKTEVFWPLAESKGRS